MKISDIYGDDIGYVELLDVMGDEFTPAEDARVSTNKGRLGPEKDAKLQARLIRDRHTSPFEGVVLKFEFCVPLFVLRELDRHRTLTKVGEDEVVTSEEGTRKFFSRNEMSGRYVQMPDQYYVPKDTRSQSKSDSQGGGYTLVPPDVSDEFLRRGKELTHQARELYSWAVEQGIEKGMARIFNTQNQYSRIRYTGSLKNWLDFLVLRLPEAAVLWECRQVALAVFRILAEKFPSVVDVWQKNVLAAVSFTPTERIIILHHLTEKSVSGDWTREEWTSILQKLGAAC